MRETIMANYGELGIILVAGVIILTAFIVLRFFRAIFSLSFAGFLLSLVSYFVYDYIFVKIPLVASLAFLLCITGFTKSSLLGKFFALLGTILSAYIIIHTLGII